MPPWRDSPTKVGADRPRWAHRMGCLRVRHQASPRGGTVNDCAPSNWTGRGPTTPYLGGRLTRLGQSGTLFATPGTCAKILER